MLNSKTYFEQGFKLANLQALQDWANYNLIKPDQGANGMKISYLADGEMFAETAINGLTIGNDYTLRLFSYEAIANAYRTKVNSLPNDNSSTVAELGYGLNERALVFTANAETMYVAIGDEIASSGVHMIVDNVSIMVDGVEGIENGEFEIDTSGWYAQNDNAVLETYAYTGAPPVENPNAPEDPLITGIAYYFASNGLDSNDGLSKSSPKQTLKELESVANGLNAGDGILLRSGDTFYIEGNSVTEVVISNINGTDSNKIVFSWYHEDDATPLALPKLSCLASKAFTFVADGADIWISNESIPKNIRVWSGSIPLDNLVELFPPGFTTSDFNTYDVVDFETIGSTSDSKLRRRSVDIPNGDYAYSYGTNIMSIETSSNFIINKWAFEGGVIWSEQLTITTSSSYVVQNSNIGNKCHRGGLFGTGFSNNWAEDIVLTHNIFDTEYLVDSNIGLDSAMTTSRGPQNTIMFGEYSRNVLIAYNNVLNYAHVGVEPFGTTYENEDPISIENYKILYNNFSSPLNWYGRPISVTGMGINCEVAYNTITDSSARCQFAWKNMHIHHNIWKDIPTSTAQGTSPGNYTGMAGQCFETTVVLGDPSDWIIENNIFENVETNALHIMVNADNIEIRNNLFIDCDTLADGQAAIYLFRYNEGDPTTSSEISIFNNLFFFNGGQQQISWGNETDGVWGTTTIANLDSAPIASPTGANIEGDPLVVDKVEYRLGAGSPGIGIALEPLATIDKDGNDIVAGVNGTGYDIGLYTQG